MILLFQVLSCNFYPQTKTWNAFGSDLIHHLAVPDRWDPGGAKVKTAQPASLAVGHLSTAASKDMPLHLTYKGNRTKKWSFNMPRSSYNCRVCVCVHVCMYICVLIIYHLTSFRYNCFRLSELAWCVARLHRKPPRLRPKRRTLRALFGWSRQACRLDRAINKNLYMWFKMI